MNYSEYGRKFSYVLDDPVLELCCKLRIFWLWVSAVI